MTAAPVPRPPIPGERAPAFSGRTHHGEVIDLQALSGAPALIMFYPFAFSRVCGAELAGLAARADEIRATGASVLAISCDSIHSLRAYAEHLGAVHLNTGHPDTERRGTGGRELPFELVSDFWPHGEIADRFGVFDSTRGAANRTSFFLDAQLCLAHTQSVPNSQARDLDEALSVLRRLAAQRPPGRG